MPIEIEERVLAVIPARAGSKSVPQKNLARVAGKPLLAWTVRAAVECRDVDRVIVTTDSEAIADVARAHGAVVPFLRPARLADDAAASIDVVLHAVEWMAEHESYRPGFVATLQPTSPFRTAADISAAIALCREPGVRSVVSVSLAKEHPHWMHVVDEAGYLRDFMATGQVATRRQDLPPVYAQNGAILIARREELLSARTWFTARTRAYIMPRERSLDIDSAQDLEIADLILAKGTPTR